MSSTEAQAGVAEVAATVNQDAPASPVLAVDRAQLEAAVEFQRRVLASADAAVDAANAKVAKQQELADQAQASIQRAQTEREAAVAELAAAEAALQGGN